MKKLHASARVIAATGILFFMICSKAFSKEQFEAKSVFFKNKPPVWQRMSSEDGAFINKFVELLLKSDSNSIDETFILKASSVMDYLKESEGRKFINGRIFRADSSLMLYVYKTLIAAYESKGDCENARRYAEKYEELEKTDYLVVRFPFIVEIYDPYIDSETYGMMKKDHFLKSFACLDKKSCFTEKEFRSVNFCYSDDDLSTDEDEESNKESKMQANEYREFKAKINISESDEHFYWRFQELSAPAYNAIRSGDPDKGIKIAEQEIKFLKKSDGRDFAVGRKFKLESSLLLDAYANLISAYDSKKDCELARAYYEKYKKVAGGDYLIVDYFYFRVYDPAGDKDVYAEKKLRDLRIIRDSVSYGNCFTKEDYEALLSDEG